jgi:hypothetical protein
MCVCSRRRDKNKIGINPANTVWTMEVTQCMYGLLSIRCYKDISSNLLLWSHPARCQSSILGFLIFSNFSGDTKTNCKLMITIFAISKHFVWFPHLFLRSISHTNLCGFLHKLSKGADILTTKLLKFYR